MSQLTDRLSHYWTRIQGTLFPFLQEQLDPLTETQLRLITILEIVRIEQFLPDTLGFEGRPTKTRSALARSFIAKMMYNINTTSFLIERLKTDKNLRRICGWESIWELPSESTFSRTFAHFAETALPQRAHEALITKAFSDGVILHKATDSTAIEAREKTKPQQKNDVKKEHRKKGRPQRGTEKSEKEFTRIEKQLTMTLEEMLDDLPKVCNKGSKKDSKGNITHWLGYKLHLDTVDGDIPVSAILTSASLHDSQVAIPLGAMTKERILFNCYDLMDAAYDAPSIIEHSQSLGHIPIIDKNPRRDEELKQAIKMENMARKNLNWIPVEVYHYNARSMSERVNARLKDEFGGCKVRVRGHMKVFCHLMFSVLALTADQLMRLIT
jgi:transposase